MSPLKLILWAAENVYHTDDPRHIGEVISVTEDLSICAIRFHDTGLIRYNLRTTDIRFAEGE